ncbi:MAG: hypothetical protein U0U25_11295 [Flavobacteriales bacterium]
MIRCSLALIALPLAAQVAMSQCPVGASCDDGDPCTVNDLFLVQVNEPPACAPGTVEFPQPPVSTTSGSLALEEQRIVSPFLHELPVARRFRKQYLWRPHELDVHMNQLAGNVDVTSGLGTCEPVSAIAFFIDIPVAATDQRFWNVTMTLKHALPGMEELSGGFANNVDTVQGCGSENAVLFPPVNAQPGWASFPLSIPFQWDGVHGVVLEVAATLAAGTASSAPLPVRYDQAVPPNDQVTYYAFAEAPFCLPCTPPIGVGECSTVNIATALSSTCGTFGSSPLRPAVRFLGGIATALPATCVCAGALLDSDADGTPDCSDVCPFGPNPGEYCDDGDPATIGDVVQEDCGCSGIPLAVHEELGNALPPFRLDPTTRSIHFSGGPFTGSLHDAQGRLLRSLANANALDMWALPPGIYLLRDAAGSSWRFPLD